MFKRDLILEPLDHQDYLFGGDNGVFNEILFKNGNSVKHLPSEERQKRYKLETMACASFSPCSVVETNFNCLIANNRLIDEDVKWLKDNGYFDENGLINFSDRRIAELSNTTQNGNTFKRPADKIREGLIPEKLWPYPEPNSKGVLVWNEYYKKPEGNTLKKIEALETEFKERFKINYEIVFRNDFKFALQYSPLVVGVYAWIKQNGIYVNYSNNANHASILTFSDFSGNLDFDTYDPFLKILSLNYKFHYYGYKWTVGVRVKKNYMKLLDKFRYVSIGKLKKEYGFCKNGKLIVGDRDAILNLFVDENAGSISKKVITVAEADFLSVPHYNLKMQKIKD